MKTGPAILRDAADSLLENGQITDAEYQSALEAIVNEDRTLSIDVAESRLPVETDEQQREREHREWMASNELRTLRGGTDDDHEFTTATKGSMCTAWVEERDPEHPGRYIGHMCGRGRSARPHRRWYVNIYESDRCYGGPEEGGWWYDMGTVELSIPITASHYYDAVRLADTLRKQYTDEGHRYNVVPRGTDYEVRVERAPAADWPSSHPRYE